MLYTQQDEFVVVAHFYHSERIRRHTILLNETGVQTWSRPISSKYFLLSKLQIVNLNLRSPFLLFVIFTKFENASCPLQCVKISERNFRMNGTIEMLQNNLLQIEML